MIRALAVADGAGRNKNLNPLVQQGLDSSNVHSADQGNCVGCIIARSGRADVIPRATQVSHQGVGVPELT